MKFSKKRPEGFEERLRVLRPVEPRTDSIVDDALSKYRRSEVAKDDILDALAAAFTALCATGRLLSMPEEAEYDEYGLRMEMVYCGEHGSEPAPSTGYRTG